MDVVYCHLQDYEFQEESKMRQEGIGKNIVVKKQNAWSGSQLQAQECSGNLAEEGVKDFGSYHHQEGASLLQRSGTVK
jgi:hypothetical protein